MSVATVFSGVFEETMKRVSSVSREYSRRNQERIEVILTSIAWPEPLRDVSRGTDCGETTIFWEQTEDLLLVQGWTVDWR